ncbi:SDR family NAD(P)-dependent oxidoreductase [Mangrovibrevibacter kandeliae]|uniref:SDR family NAD(P)-dependent oxidoreductase n=1 Tax=Mangrovibrevibacter kandeliae TaxID=2968473 RepID=UPI002118C812|nr:MULTISPECIES: SDR family NAD(P)-dependent oxidoreductase [unclassified Aurantimonas]MCQ8783237.1 SDR family oxidoreductase [Aurantimonas sp. CSK15Z-1]MCW4116248.1 SDR family oxidoreductase [Aurantimonas sp. MSK8Z-1]
MALNGRVAIVTGAAKGIGNAIARRFASDGARVMLADIDEKAGAQAVEELAEIGEVAFLSADVSERLDARNLLAATLDRFGEVDILVNNAGIVHKAGFLELQEEDFDRVLRVNLKGAFLCGQAVAQHMVERVEAGGPAGTIINMSSINAEVAIPDQVGYCVSKGGLTQLTKVMALSLAKYGIRVNAIGPGSIMTDILRSVARDKDAMRGILARTPLGRVAEPREIASIAAFLASEDASYITGETIFADGGRLALNYTVPVED